jgi:DNA-binding transcriptional MerR regulator
VSSRTYLSIGDVLTLLREEFPDVTISKIRFLESQGLVNPERSPSGYRKFFDHDVERLRWVLRQQREHFLPLKVIRDRLADGELDDSGDYGNGKQFEHAHASPGGTVATRRAHGTADAPAEDAPTRADEEVMARILADASRRAASMPAPAEGSPSRRGTHAASASTDEPPTDPGPGSKSRRAEPVAGTAPRGGASPGPRHAAGSAEGGPAGRGKPDTSGSGAPAAGSSGGGGRSGSGGDAPPPAATGRRGQGSKNAANAASAASATVGIVTGASMTADELCSASGLSPEELAALESFGLVEAVAVAGILTYDEEALTVANLASSFRAFGIEPRHLRLYRNAADREMGLIEQVVIPLLRQRNPESRQRAIESADQLAALGQTMRATLLRLALRRHLGG